MFENLEAFCETRQAELDAEAGYDPSVVSDPKAVRGASMKEYRELAPIVVKYRAVPPAGAGRFAGRERTAE